MPKPSPIRTRVVEAYKAMPDAKLATIAEAAGVSYIPAWRHLKAHLGVTLETHQVRAEVEAEQEAEAMLQPVVNTGQCTPGPHPDDSIGKA